MVAAVPPNVTDVANPILAPLIVTLLPPVVEPLGGEMLLIIGVDGVLPLTVSVSTFDAVFCGLLLSRTVTVTLNMPETVGVPKGAPDEELIDMPLGRPEADQL